MMVMIVVVGRPGRIGQHVHVAVMVVSCSRYVAVRMRMAVRARMYTIASVICNLVPSSRTLGPISVPLIMMYPMMVLYTNGRHIMITPNRVP